MQPRRTSYERASGHPGHPADTHGRARRLQVALFVLALLCGVAAFWTGLR